MVAKESVRATTSSARFSRFILSPILSQICINLYYFFQFPLFLLGWVSPQIILESEITDLTLETEAFKGVFPPFVILSFFSFLLLFFFFFFFFCASIMGQPSLSLPSFSDFAKIFSPFLHRAMCSSIKPSKEPEG